jgi:hypothetical protein
MRNKILFCFFTIFLFGFQNKPIQELKKDNCIECDDDKWQKAELYLADLKRQNIKSVKAKSIKVDSLGVVIEVKNSIINFQKVEINSLKSELSEKPKEIIRIDTVKVIIKETKSFWGGKKTDTIK